jgi:hypothetical protein
LYLHYLHSTPDHKALTDIYIADSGTDDESVPFIGLLLSSVGGTLIEQWAPIGIAGLIPDLYSSCTDLVPRKQVQKPLAGALFNSMLAPFANMSVQHFLWYQGALLFEYRCANLA